MRDGWRSIRLGEVFEPSNDRVGDDAEPPVFSVTKHSGVVLASDYFDRRVASDSLAGYKVLRPDDWAYSTIHIDEGSIARNHLPAAGAVSPMYTTMRFAGRDHEAGYFELLLRSPEMLARYSSVQQGSINRRRSLPWKSFAAIEVDVPSRNEQRRIVDLVGVLDDAIEAAERLLSTARETARQLRKREFARLAEECPAARADQVADMLLGRQRSARQSVGAHVIPYIRAANIGPDGFRLDDLQTMNFDPAEQRKYGLRRDDVLLVEGGSIGFSALWAGQRPGVFGFDKHVIRMRAIEGVSLPGYLLQWTKWARESGLFDAQATGVTIKALGFARASAMPMPAPTIQQQAQVSDLLHSVEEVISRGVGDLESQRALRSNLLTALLSGEHEIPESYDALIDRAEVA